MSKPILALGAIAAAITAAWALLARIGPLLRKAAHFIDDVAGEPARPGQPARPGVFHKGTWQRSPFGRDIPAVAENTAAHRYVQLIRETENRWPELTSESVWLDIS